MATLKTNKVSKREVMTRAWELFNHKRIVMGRELPGIYKTFAEALKRAWELVKEETNPHKAEFKQFAADKKDDSNMTYLVRNVAMNINY